MAYHHQITLDAIRSNDRPYCARCGDVITAENDSGWEAFVGDGTITQSLCKWCKVIDDLPATVAKEA